MKFYTYMWLREDGSPYYVGKGSGQRALYRLEKRVPAPSRQRILIQEFPSEQEALSAEQFFISFYGRKDIGTGCLRNRTDGGDSGPGLAGKNHPMFGKPGVFKGRKHSESAKRRMSTLAFERNSHLSSEEKKKYASYGSRGRIFSQETRQRMRQKMLGNTNGKWGRAGKPEGAVCG